MPFGYHIRKKFGASSYALAFTAYSGEFMEGKNIVSMTEATPGTLEYDIGQKTDAPEFFLNFDPISAGQISMARPLGYVFHQGNWPSAFDGMFWLRTERPYILRPN